MKRTCLIWMAFTLVSTLVKAQSGNGLSLSFGPEFSIPFNTNSYDYGHIRDFYSDGIGGNVKLGVPLDKSFSFILSAGFVSYSAKDAFITPLAGGDGTISSPTVHYTFIPVTAGLRFYFAKELYIDGEAGVAAKVYTNSSTNVIYGGGVGVVAPTGKRGGLDLSLKYMRGYEIYYYPLPMSQLSMGVAYKFGL